MARPGIIWHPKRGSLLSDGSANPGLVDTLTWLIDSWDGLKGGEGIEIAGKDSEHPEIRLKLTVGEGLKIEKDGTNLKISLASEDDDSDDDSGGDKAGGGGNGSSGGLIDSYGDGSYGSGGGGSGSSWRPSGGGGGGGGGGGDGTSSCNDFTENDGVSNDWGGDPSNEGDNCRVVNGW